jgi:hypothetical protein
MYIWYVCMETSADSGQAYSRKRDSGQSGAGGILVSRLSALHSEKDIDRSSRLKVPAAVDTFVSIMSTDPTRLTVVGGGVTVLAGLNGSSMTDSSASIWRFLRSLPRRAGRSSGATTDAIPAIRGPGRNR